MPSGRVVDELPASKRPGLNRVIWSMREKPPRVPPAAQLAFCRHARSARPARHLHRAHDEGRQSHGNEAQRRRSIAARNSTPPIAKRNTMPPCACTPSSARRARSWIASCRLRGALAKTAKDLPEGDALRKTLKDFDDKVDAVRKQIVATTEGGAITGEERLREHTDQLYGALLSYEGKPGAYQMAYIDALQNGTRRRDEGIRAAQQPRICRR